MGAFEVSRSQWIDAPPAQVRAHIEDFRAWQQWSPWEDLDPDLHRDYSEPSGGLGASYAWEGNKRAGIGSMEITGLADDRVDVRLRFLKPFKAENHVTFELQPFDDGTQTTWRMTGEQKGLMAVFGRLFPMDRLVGKDFEKGLARLKDVAEAG